MFSQELMELREELFDTVHADRPLLTHWEWDNVVTDELLEIVQKHIESANPAMPQYVFKFGLQLWDDTFSPRRKIGESKPITVIGTTQKEAWAEAERMLGPSESRVIYGRWLVSVKDVNA